MHALPRPVHAYSSVVCPCDILTCGVAPAVCGLCAVSVQVGGVNRDGVIQLVDPDFFGKVTWDSTFSLDTQTQQHMLDVCADIEALDFVSRNPDNPVVGLVSGWQEVVEGMTP